MKDSHESEKTGPAKKGGAHSHDHEHGDGHHHHHDHDHPHDHEPTHNHDHDDDDSRRVTETASRLSGGLRDAGAPGAGADVPFDDSSSTALSEALRSSFVIVKVIMAGLIVLFFVSGVFTVKPQERAIIFRLGKPVGEGDARLLGPGLHWSFPYPIDEVKRIPIGEIQSVQSRVGWFSISAEDELAGVKPMAMGTLNPNSEGYVLTADANIIHVRATLRYRIIDPISYVFNFSDASNVVLNALDNSIIYAATQFTVDRIQQEQSAFKEKILARMNNLVQQAGLGIVLDPTDVQIMIPADVMPAFDAVLAAFSDQSKVLNEAKGYENTILSRAVGEAGAITNNAFAEREQMLSTLAIEAKYLEERLPDYQKNPDLFRQRLMTETWRRILTNSQEKVILLQRGGTRELRLMLNRELSKSPAQTNR